MFALTIGVLSSGWADLRIDFGPKCVMCYFENVPRDALADILLSAIRVLKTSSDSTISFPNGAQKSTMCVKALAKATCKITFENDSLIMPTAEYAKAVFKMFDGYIHEYSLEEYTLEWGIFPLQELEYLRSAFHNAK